MIKNDLNTLELTADELSPISIDGMRLKGLEDFSIENTMGYREVMITIKMVANLKDSEDRANAEAISNDSPSKDMMKEAPTVPVQELNVNSNIKQVRRPVFGTDPQRIKAQFNLALTAFIIALAANLIALYRLLTK